MVYYESEDYQVKSLSKLLDIYYSSVGINSVLLLNVPPDTCRLINEIDARRLRKLGKVLYEIFDETEIYQNTNFF